MRRTIELKLATRLINHSPVVMVGSLFNGKVNVTPVAWHMPIQKMPPMVSLEIGENHFIFDCILDTGDFTLNVLPSGMADDIVSCGRMSGRDVDKVGLCRFSLTSSKEINSPGLDDSLAIIECVLVPDNYLAEKYNILIGEIKHAEAHKAAFTDHWIFAGHGKKTLHHLGDRTFCTPDEKIIDMREEV